MILLYRADPAVCQLGSGTLRVELRAWHRADDHREPGQEGVECPGGHFARPLTGLAQPTDQQDNILKPPGHVPERPLHRSRRRCRPLEDLFARLLSVDAEELPVEDPAALARALDQVARGEVVHLVRDGQPVADLVPASADSHVAQAQQVARAITQRMAERFGAPTLAHYRRVYESCGQPWPGDEEIRHQFPVADAS